MNNALPFCRVCKSYHNYPDSWAYCIAHLQQRLSRLEQIFESTDFAKLAYKTGALQ